MSAARYCRDGQPVSKPETAGGDGFLVALTKSDGVEKPIGSAFVSDKKSVDATFADRVVSSLRGKTSRNRANLHKLKRRAGHIDAGASCLCRGCCVKEGQGTGLWLGRQFDQFGGGGESTSG